MHNAPILMKACFDWSRVAPCYQEAHRVYHDEQHIQHMLRESAQLELDQDERKWLEAVIWLHDAYHDPIAPHGYSERLSADLLDTSLGDAFSEEGKTLARAAIEASARALEEQTGLHPLTQVFLDLDLSGLGGSALAFKRHTERVIQEYRNVGMEEDRIRKANEKFASALLKKENIYYTQTMRDAYEGMARANLIWMSENPTEFMQG